MKYFAAFTLIILIHINCIGEKPDSLEKKQWVAVHLLDFTTDETLQKLEEMIPDYAAKGVNLIFLEVDYSFQFNSHPELIPDKFITFKAARHFAKVCKLNNIRVVPEFQCLGHQSWAQYTFSLLTKYPELDLTPGEFPDNKGLYCREWDPTNPKVNEIVFPLIDEIVDAFQADGIHVGMDEVFLLGSDKSPNTKGKSPSELFAKVVNEFHNHFVKQKGLEMFMWGDRLIDGKKTGYGAWEGSTNGTYPAVDIIPKDIIICDWHYRPGMKYPSIPMFLEKGFRVLPCSFNDAQGVKTLIQYSLKQENPRMIGHMFTTWSGVPKDSLLLYPPFNEGLKVLKEKKIWPVKIDLNTVNTDGTISILLSSEKKNISIFYTLDGSTPDLHSIQYKEPVILTKPSIISAVTYIGDKPSGEVMSKSYTVHLATGKSVKFNHEPDYLPKDQNALVNGIIATPSYSDGQWIGFDGKDVEAIIDLQSTKEVSKVSFNCFYDPMYLIYPGSSAEVLVSNDGVKFASASKTNIKSILNSSNIPFELSFKKTKARYIKVIINKSLVPKDAKHGAGTPASIFLDELMVY